jgi:hypothetical protein
MTITAVGLFDRYLRPLYPEELRTDEALIVARQTDANPARNPRLLAQIDEAAEVFAQLGPQLVSAHGGFLPRLTDDDEGVARLSFAIDRQFRDTMLGASSPGDPEAPIVRFLTHAAPWLCRVIALAHQGEIGVRRPLWESIVTLRSRAGEAVLAPFAWLLHALSDDEIDRGGLGARYRHYVERARFDPMRLRPIVGDGGARKLPKLSVVRYDTLHKYLRAHLPELSDLGRDFPSAEQLDDLGFLALEFELLAGGRMLLMHGRGRRGLHLMWLDATGFSHAMFLPADPGDPHELTIEGDVMTLRFMQDGEPRVHQLLYWG